MRLSAFLRNGRNAELELVIARVPTVSQKKGTSLSILDTIETTVLLLQKNIDKYIKIKIEFLDILLMSNGEFRKDKYKRLGHRIAVLAKRFKYKNE